MFMALLAFLAGFALSATAAWYSIVGLMAIFPGAKVPIIIMGVALEFAKLVAASWIYRNWKKSPFLIRAYMTTAVLVLIFITSMGIFGFLSKSHLEHSLTAGAETRAQIATIDTQLVSREKSRDFINRQLDALDDSLDRYIELGYVTKGLDQMKQLEEDRKELEAQRATLEEEIIDLNARRNELDVSIKKVEVEVGPLRYIAELIYGEENAPEHFDQTVRWVIILLVSVFDPFAVALLLAGNISLMQQVRPQRSYELDTSGPAIEDEIISHPDAGNISLKVDPEAEIVYTANSEPVPTMVMEEEVELELVPEEPVTSPEKPVRVGLLDDKPDPDNPLDEWNKHREDWYSK
jgi:cell division protein FtsB